MITKKPTAKDLFNAYHNHQDDGLIARIGAKYYKIKTGVVELAEYKFLTLKFFVVTVIIEETKRSFCKIYSEENLAKDFITSIRNKKTVM